MTRMFCEHKRWIFLLSARRQNHISERYFLFPLLLERQLFHFRWFRCLGTCSLHQMNWQNVFDCNVFHENYIKLCFATFPLHWLQISCLACYWFDFNVINICLPVYYCDWLLSSRDKLNLKTYSRRFKLYKINNRKFIPMFGAIKGARWKVYTL